MDDYSVKFSKRSRMLVAILVMALLLTGFTAMANKSLVVEREGKSKEYKTFANTVGAFLKKEGIQIEEQGYINYSLDDKIENNMQIIIKDPKTYSLKLGDKVEEGLVSPFNTVEEVLDDLNYKLGEKDYTKPASDTQIKDGDMIELFRVKEIIEEKEVKIPFEKIVRDNKDMDKGETKVLQEGKDGIKKEKVKKTLVNDQLESSEIIEEKIVKQPVDHLVDRGSRKLVATSRGKSQFKKTLTMTATAYDDTPQSQGKWVGRTATGIKPRKGVAAVDPRVIPLGTKLYVEGYGECIAADTGGAIKGNRIDLFFHSRQEVKNFGRRKVKVYILD